MMHKLALSLAISLFFVGAAQANNCNPNGFGGMRGSDGTHITSDGFGGTRITSPNGQCTHCVSNGFGGTNCN
ncbi:TPA: hypothetical protein ACF7ZB_000196 [Kluyvera georgiana]